VARTAACPSTRTSERGATRARVTIATGRACRWPDRWARSVAREQHRSGHAAGRADADQAATRATALHLVRDRGDDPPAGRRPRVTDRDRAAVHVHPRPIHWTGRLALPALLPRHHVRDHLRRERL